MGSVSKLNLPVEINIQDCFWGNLPHCNSGKQTGICPISASTWETWFKEWLAHLSEYLPLSDGYEVTLRLTDDPEIQLLNYKYRGKNQPTDVLAFAALEAKIAPKPQELLVVEPLYLGDIVISVETAFTQAKQQQNSLTRELAWLTTHGLLHLLGWDHPDDESLAEMLSWQENLLQIVGQ